MKHQIGPYMFSYPIWRKRVGSTHYIIGFADAYNARGLIGPEHNGIFVLDETRKMIVLDRHTPLETGYFGPNEDIFAEFSRLKALTPKAWRAWVSAHPRTRPDYR